MISSKIKPICPMWRFGDITIAHRKGFSLGVKDTLRISGVSNYISTLNARYWMKPYNFVGKIYGSPLDFFLERGKFQSVVRGFLNADTILGCFQFTTFSSYYPIVFVKEQLYINRAGIMLEVAGLAQSGIGCVISVYGANQLKTEYEQVDYTRFLISHEIGHIFGLVANDRADFFVDDQYYGRHCANQCVMMVNIDEKMQIRDILRKQLFCEQCEAELIRNFI